MLCATGRDFTAFLPTCRVQKTERYSAQRHFTEVWDLRDCDLLTSDAADTAETAVLPSELIYLPCRAPMPEIAEINAFIGAYLRLEVLLKRKEYDRVLEEVKSFFGHTEQQTGTLWEYRQDHGSRNHCFASYALITIDRALARN